MGFKKHLYPIMEFDEAREAVIEPGGGALPEMPERLLLCFFQDVLERLEARGELEAFYIHPSETGPKKLYRTAGAGERVAVVHPGCGASYSIIMEERCIAWGANKIMACGGAGVLAGDLPLGALLVPERAVRDEGASYHYLPPAREIEIDGTAVEILCRTLEEEGFLYRRIKTWTTDGFYRETRARAAARKAEGCQAVEMECSAFAAVARFRGAGFGQLLYSGDTLAGPEWQKRDWMNQKELREEVLRLTLKALRNWR